MDMTRRYFVKVVVGTVGGMLLGDKIPIGPPPEHLTKHTVPPEATPDAMVITGNFDILDWLAQEAKLILARCEDGRVLGEAKVQLRREGSKLAMAGEDLNVLSGTLDNICIANKHGNVLLVAYQGHEFYSTSRFLSVGDSLRIGLTIHEEKFEPSK